MSEEQRETDVGRSYFWMNVGHRGKIEGDEVWVILSLILSRWLNY